jgi:hypothetical protein
MALDSECRYAKCHYSECRGASQKFQNKNIFFFNKNKKNESKDKENGPVIGQNDKTFYNCNKLVCLSLQYMPILVWYLWVSLCANQGGELITGKLMTLSQILGQGRNAWQFKRASLVQRGGCHAVT